MREPKTPPLVIVIVLRLERFSVALANLNDGAYIHLFERGQHRRGALRFKHSACNREPSARHAAAFFDWGHSFKP